MLMMRDPVTGEPLGYYLDQPAAVQGQRLNGLDAWASLQSVPQSNTEPHWLTGAPHMFVPSDEDVLWGPSALNSEQAEIAARLLREPRAPLPEPPLPLNG